MAKNALVRLVNVGKQIETVYVGNDKRDVIPGGTVLVPENHVATRLRQFRLADQVGVDPRIAPQDVARQAARLKDENAELQQRLAELEAQLAATKAVSDQPPTPPTPAYPQHIGGGVWLLSDGTKTPGGTNRATAEELQAEIDRATSEGAGSNGQE